MKKIYFLIFLFSLSSSIQFYDNSYKQIEIDKDIIQVSMNDYNIIGTTTSTHSYWIKVIKDSKDFNLSIDNIAIVGTKVNNIQLHKVSSTEEKQKEVMPNCYEACQQKNECSIIQEKIGEECKYENVCNEVEICKQKSFFDIFSKLEYCKEEESNTKIECTNEYICTSLYKDKEVCKEVQDCKEKCDKQYIGYTEFKKSDKIDSIETKSKEEYYILSFETPIFESSQFNITFSKTDITKGVKSTKKSTLDPNIGACGILNESNSEYLLTSDVTSNNNINCFTINATNVTLDCQGYKLYGNWKDYAGSWGIYSNSTYGVYFQDGGGNNSTVKNCFISGFGAGIGVWDANNFYILNNTINDSRYGLAPFYYGVVGNEYGLIENNTITNGYLYSTTYFSVGIFGNLSNMKIRNNIINNSYYGIYLYESNSNNITVYNNSINNCTFSGIRIETYNTTIFNNTISNSNRIFSGFTTSAPNSLIMNNTIILNNSGLSIINTTKQILTILNTNISYGDTWVFYPEITSKNVTIEFSSTSFNAEQYSGYPHVFKVSGVAGKMGLIINRSYSEIAGTYEPSTTALSYTTSWIPITTSIDTTNNWAYLTSTTASTYAFGATNYITSCMRINVSGTYALNQSITGGLISQRYGYPYYMCIETNVTDFDLNCNYNQIIGNIYNESSYGIFAYSTTSAIKNCNITDFKTFILAYGTTYSKTLNITAKNTNVLINDSNLGVGIYGRSDTTYIEANNINVNNSKYGLSIYRGSNINISNIYINNSKIGLKTTRTYRINATNLYLDNYEYFCFTDTQSPRLYYRHAYINATCNGNNNNYFGYGQSNLDMDASSYQYIQLYSSNNITIRNFYNNKVGYGIYLDNCTNITITNSIFNNSKISIETENSIGLEIYNTTIYDNMNSEYGYSIYSQWSKNLLIKNLTFIGNYSSIVLAGVMLIYGNNNTIDGAYFEGGYYDYEPLWLASNSNSTFKNILYYNITSANLFDYSTQFIEGNVNIYIKNITALNSTIYSYPILLFPGNSTLVVENILIKDSTISNLVNYYGYENTSTEAGTIYNLTIENGTSSIKFNLINVSGYYQRYYINNSIIINPDFASVDSTTYQELNSSGTVTLAQTESHCSMKVKRLGGFPTSKTDITTLGLDYPASISCNNNLATFLVSSFSGYTLENVPWDNGLGSGGGIEIVTITPSISNETIIVPAIIEELPKEYRPMILFIIAIIAILILIKYFGGSDE